MERLNTEYKTWLQTLGFSKSTVYNYPKMVFYFLEWLEKQNIHDIYLLKNHHLKTYFLYLETRQNFRKKGALSTAHLNKTFDAIDKFLEYLQQMGANTPSPTGYRILQDKTLYISKIKVLTKDQIKELYTASEQIYNDLPFELSEPRQALAKVILDLCYGCGLRKSEAHNLMISDVDLDKKLLFIRQAKGNKDRLIPITENIKNRLQTFIYQHHKTLLNSPLSRIQNKENYHKKLLPISQNTLPFYIQKITEQSNLEQVIGLHTLRHSIATHFLQAGMSIENIAKFLGHSSLESTQIYTHLI